jgi:cobalt/nickel transport system permease protein
MVCETFAHGDSPLHRLDPRGRVAAAVALSVLLAVSESFPVLLAGLALAVALVVAARLPAGALARRLVGLNVFVVLLAVLLPLTMGGPLLGRLGPLGVSRLGALLAARVALKANSIVLAFTALLSTVELVTLGHALVHLRVPDKLVQLLFFTVRYVDVLHHEYRRLRTAMRARCFRPRVSRHTYRSFGYLVGMLLVGSLDRSQRVIAAMKCRGFRGRFHVFDHFCWHRRDTVFALASALVLAGLVCGELL